MDLNRFLINDPSPDALESLGSYKPSPGQIGWDLEGANKTVWAVGLGIFNPCKKKRPCSSSKSNHHFINEKTTKGFS